MCCGCRMSAAATAEMTWQSELFAAAPSSGSAQRMAWDQVQRLSPRAAFQEVLWQRAALFDIREPALRATEGALSPSLAQLSLDRTVTGQRVIVLCQDGSHSPAIAASLARHGFRQVADVIGGFAAWRSLGLPITS